jgi:RNA 3'-terminal phosphate cyclase (RTC), insert domain
MQEEAALVLQEKLPGVKIQCELCSSAAVGTSMGITLVAETSTGQGLLATNSRRKELLRAVCFRLST